MLDRTSFFTKCKSNAFYCLRQNSTEKLQGKDSADLSLSERVEIFPKSEYLRYCTFI